MWSPLMRRLYVSALLTGAIRQPKPSKWSGVTHQLVWPTTRRVSDTPRFIMGRIPSNELPPFMKESMDIKPIKIQVKDKSTK